MTLDINTLAKKSWTLFIEKPVEHVLAGFILAILSVVTLGLLMGPLTVGYIRMCEKQRTGQQIQLGELFAGFDAFGSSLGAFILYAVGVSIGLMLLVLPGAVLSVAWAFAFHFIALRQEGAIASLGSSWRLFRAQLSSVVTCVLLVLVVSLVAGASVILSLVATPLCLIFTTLAFVEMTER